MALTSEQGKALADKRWKDEKRNRLTLDRVELELPPLTDIESAMQRLDVVCKWALAGMIHGAIASAAVRSVEVWLRGHESKLTQHVIDQLTADVKRLKAGLKGRVA